MSLLDHRPPPPNLLHPRSPFARAPRRTVAGVDGQDLNRWSEPFAQAAERLLQTRVDRLVEVLGQEGWWISAIELRPDDEERAGLNPDWKSIAGNVFDRDYKRSLRELAWFAGYRGWTKKPIPFGGWDIGNGVRILPPEALPDDLIDVSPGQIGFSDRRFGELSQLPKDEIPPGAIIRKPMLEQAPYLEKARQSLVEQLKVWGREEFVANRPAIEDWFTKQGVRGLQMGASIAKQAIAGAIAAREDEDVGDKTYRWQLGIVRTVHCLDCEGRDGEIYTTEELDAIGYPGSGSTECFSNCACSLEEVDNGRGRLNRFLQAGLEAALAEQDDLIEQAELEAGFRAARAPRPRRRDEQAAYRKGLEIGRRDRPLLQPDLTSAVERLSLDDLLPASSRAIAGYNGHPRALYVNEGLREGGVPSQYRDLVEGLDEAMRRGRVTRSLVATRSFGYDTAAQSFHDVVGLVGRTITDPAYQSLALTQDGLERTDVAPRPIRMDVILPRGTRGVSVDQALESDDVSEAVDEFILPRSSTLRLDGVWLNDPGTLPEMVIRATVVDSPDPKDAPRPRFTPGGRPDEEWTSGAVVSGETGADARFVQDLEMLDDPRWRLSSDAGRFLSWLDASVIANTDDERVERFLTTEVGRLMPKKLWRQLEKMDLVADV